MNNYQTLNDLIETSSTVLDRTAEQLEKIARSGDEPERDALAAQAVAASRRRVAEELRLYARDLRSNAAGRGWVQYTPEQDPDELVENLARERSVEGAFQQLQDVDEALQRGFAFASRQDAMTSTREVCQQAIVMLEKHRREVTTAVRTAVDI